MRQTPVEHQKKSGILHTLDSWHREFDYVTACYLLEPWERRIVKGIIDDSFSYPGTFLLMKSCHAFMHLVIEAKSGFSFKL